MSSGVVTLLLQIILGVCIYAGCCLVYFIVAKDQMIVGMLDRLLKKVKVKL